MPPRSNPEKPVLRAKKSPAPVPRPRKEASKAESAPASGGGAKLSDIPLEYRKKYLRFFAYLFATLFFFSPIHFNFKPNPVDFTGNVSDKNKFFREFLVLYEQGDEAKILAQCSPEGKGMVQKYMKPILDSVKQAGTFQAAYLLNTQWRNKDHSWDMVYFVEYEKGNGITEFKVRPEGQGFLVDRFIVRAVYKNFRDFCKFPTIVFFSYPGSVFLLIGYLLILWNASTLVDCWYSPLKSKWLWMLTILVGVGTLFINLEPGPLFQLNLLSLRFPVTAIGKNPLWAPWQMQLTFPIGMVAFWMEMRKVRKSLK